MIISMSFDGLVTNEEVAAYFREKFPTEDSLIEGRDFVHIEVCRRLEQALTMKGARTVLNKSAIFQYVCRQKGCLLGALVPIRGKNYWISQQYVTAYVDVETGEVDENGNPIFELISSIPDYVSHSSHPQLSRDAGLNAICVHKASLSGPDDYVLSCRHTSVTASVNFEEEKRKARTKKYRALYI